METKMYVEVKDFGFHSSLNPCPSCKCLVHDNNLDEDIDGNMVCPDCVD